MSLSLATEPDYVRARILDEAKRLICHDRQAIHGNPDEFFDKLALVWGALLNIDITGTQAALMLSAFKTVRAFDNPNHADNFIDLCGYGALAGEQAR